MTKAEGSSAEAAAVIPTACQDWSLIESGEGRFWWNDTYSISIWEKSTRVLCSGIAEAAVTDTDVWRGFTDFQLRNVFKQCGVCRGPGEVMWLCCYCGATVHYECGEVASPEQIAWKPSNKGYEDVLCVCMRCGGLCNDTPRPQPPLQPDIAPWAAKRILTLEEDELPAEARTRVSSILESACALGSSSDGHLITALQDLIQGVFQSPESLSFLKKEVTTSKGGGIGVVAAADIPAFSIIGIYPGYKDEMAGEHMKFGRPVTKYALMDLNCANYVGDVFVEFQTTFTPFINEPNESEMSNCGWIQEQCCREGRLSVMSCRDIKQGEELLIGYGPIYPRSYPYRYDAYCFHLVEGYEDPACFGLWHCRTTNEAESEFVCYVRYDKETNRYVFWESQAQTEERLAKTLVTPR